MKYCDYCKVGHVLPNVGESNVHWYWGKSSKLKDGGRHMCKAYLSDYRKEYRRSKQGWAVTQWNTQNRSSKRRAHPKPNYTSGELLEWALKQPNFDELFSDWEESGHKRDLKPSCDRIDDMKPYTLDNLRIVTQKENVLMGARSKKAKARMTKAIQKTMGIPVEQYDKEGNLLEVYISAGEAGRATGVDQSHITKCCKGKLKTVGGYVWKYNTIER